jgi:hypothetical protein
MTAVNVVWATGKVVWAVGEVVMGAESLVLRLAIGSDVEEARPAMRGNVSPFTREELAGQRSHIVAMGSFALMIPVRGIQMRPPFSNRCLE